MDNLDIEREFRLYRSVVEMDEHLRKATGEAMTAELLQALSSMKIMLDSVKLLKGYGDEVEDTQKRGEFMRIIGELSVEVAEAQIRLSGELKAKEILECEIETLKAEVIELRSPSIKPVKKGKFYEGQNGEGPYCPQCWEGSKTLSLISNIGPGGVKCSSKDCGFRDFDRLRGPSVGFTL